MKKTLRLCTAAALALLLGGCGIFLATARDRAAKNTPGFKAGFADGCASATVQDTNYRDDMIRDEAYYKADKHYRTGWASGFHNCRNRSTHNPADRGGPIPDDSPGAKRF